MKTKMLKKEDIVRKWYHIDASDKVLGRLSTSIAVLLSGKDRADYTPHVDAGAGVVVTNCDKVKVTGNKETQKEYKRFSGYPSGQTVTTYEKMIRKKPEHILRHAVKGMLPKNRLGSKMLKRLKLYAGEEHRQEAQKPEKLEI